MADENDVDTVTPLDGDGQNVVFPTPAGEEDATRFGNVSAEDYDTKGRTTVATPYGYAFASSDKEIPLVSHAGLQVTADIAEALVAESDACGGKVYIVTDDESEEN